MLYIKYMGIIIIKHARGSYSIKGMPSLFDSLTEAKNYIKENRKYMEAFIEEEEPEPTTDHPLSSYIDAARVRKRKR